MLNSKKDFEVDKYKYRYKIMRLWVSSVPKITLSLASEIIEALRRSELGRTPYEAAKNILIMYVERCTEFKEKGKILATILRNIFDKLNEIPSRFTQHLSLPEVAADLIVVLDLTIVALEEVSTLPLSVGEKLCVAAFNRLCKRFSIKLKEQLRKRSAESEILLATYIPTAYITVFHIAIWMLSLLAEVDYELKDLGYTDVQEAVEKLLEAGTSLYEKSRS